MTDTEKLNAIRAEVQNYIDAAHKAHTNITEGNFAHLLSFIDSLQEEPVSEQNLSNVQRFGKIWKEPVSEDLEEASKEWLRPQLDKSYANYGEKKMMELTHFDGYAMLDAIEYGMRLQKEQMMAKAIDGEVGYWNLRGLSINVELPRSVNEGDKVKVIVKKEG